MRSAIVKQALAAARLPLDTAERGAAIHLSRTVDALASELGIDPRGAVGLTPDAIKFHPRYRAALAGYRQAFAALREFNVRAARVAR